MEQNRRLVLATLLLCVGLAQQVAADSADNSGLLKMLLRKYDKTVIPDDFEGKGINLTHGLSLYRLVNFENQVLELDCIITMHWLDTRLVWDSEVFDTADLRVQGGLIWKPDMIVMNSADPIDSRMSDGFNAVVSATGDVGYYVPAKLRTYCILNDDNCCDIVFMSWTYDGGMLDLLLKSETVDLTDLEDFNRFWEVKSATAKRESVVYPCCPEPYPKVTYTICLQRKRKAGRETKERRQEVSE